MKNGNKMKKETLKEKIGKSLIKVLVYGWEQGKKQTKFPYDYTLADEKIVKKELDQLLKLFAQRGSREL